MSTEYGLQLYSVRDAVAADMRTTLANVAEIGYKKVEFAGFGGLSAEELAEELRRNSLVAVGTHTGVDALSEEKLAATIAYHKTIGCHNLIIPSADTSTNQALESLIETVNRVQPLLEKEGITLHYHNHAVEWQPNQDGAIPELELFARTALRFEIDVYWTYVAGEDPVSRLQEFSDRVSLIHLKDGTKEAGTYLGRGHVPIPAIREWALAHGVDMIVESEDQTPDGITEVTACFRYLETLA